MTDPRQPSTISTLWSTLAGAENPWDALFQWLAEIPDEDERNALIANESAEVQAALKALIAQSSHHRNGGIGL